MSFTLAFIVLLSTNLQFVAQAHPLPQLTEEDIVSVIHVTQDNYKTLNFTQDNYNTLNFASAFVLVSWISLLIPPSYIEGRLGVLMASLLAEVNISLNACSFKVRDSKCKTRWEASVHKGFIAGVFVRSLLAHFWAPPTKCCSVHMVPKDPKFLTKKHLTKKHLTKKHAKKPL